jgi:hypothetical protein
LNGVCIALCALLILKEERYATMNTVCCREIRGKRSSTLARCMIGRVSEIEDLVREASLRSRASERREIISQKACLLPLITRLALDSLKSACVTREPYGGAWLPELILTVSDSDLPLYGCWKLLARLSAPYFFCIRSLSTRSVRAVRYFQRVRPVAAKFFIAPGRPCRTARRVLCLSCSASVNFCQSGRGYGASDQRTGRRPLFPGPTVGPRALEPQASLWSVSCGASHTAASGPHTGPDQWLSGSPVLLNLEKLADLQE